MSALAATAPQRTPGTSGPMHTTHHHRHLSAAPAPTPIEEIWVPARRFAEPTLERLRLVSLIAATLPGLGLLAWLLTGPPAALREVLAAATGVYVAAALIPFSALTAALYAPALRAYVSTTALPAAQRHLRVGATNARARLAHAMSYHATVRTPDVAVGSHGPDLHPARPVPAALT